MEYCADSSSEEKEEEQFRNCATKRDVLYTLIHVLMT